MMREKHRWNVDGNKVVRSSPQTFNQPLSAKWKEPAKVLRLHEFPLFPEGKR